MAHPFYARLNRVLEENGFDAFVTGAVRLFVQNGWDDRRWPRGRSFRLLLIGYFKRLIVRGDRLAGGGFVGAAEISGGAAGGDATPLFHDFQHSAADRPGN